MLIRRRLTRRPTTVGAVCFISLCVLMQMLGTTMTFWNLDLPLDSIDTQTWEGFSLPTSPSGLGPSPANKPYQYPAQSFRLFLREQTLFHPPNLFL